MRIFRTTLVLSCLASFETGAQTKLPVPSKDYGQFETLANTGPDGGLSPDGKWLAYGINRSSRDNELRVVSIAGGAPKIMAFGARPAFSSDSRWVAYSIGFSEAQEDKLRKDKKPIHHKLGLLSLATAEQTVIDGVEDFAFSPNGAFLAFRRYAPDKPDKKDKSEAADSAADETPAGATLIVHNLATGRDTTFGNVSDWAWQDLPEHGRLLALAISAEDKTGNGVQVFDPETGSLRVLDSSAAVYSELAWRRKSADLAVLKSKTDEQHDGPAQIVLAWVHLSESTEKSFVYDPTKDSKFPAQKRTVAYRHPSWSEDGEVLFFGIAKWDSKLPKGDKEKEADEQPAVDVWHWRDTIVLPKQKIDAKRDREKNTLAAWRLDQPGIVQLGHSLTEQVTPLKHQKVAYATDWTSYAMQRSIGRPAADLYLVDLATGDRTKLRDRVLDDYQVHGSPGGRYLLYWQDSHFWTVDVTTHAIVNITKNVPTSFADLESDATGQQKQDFGVAGWTRNDAAVILYDKFDLWQVAPDGSGATRLTDGANDQVRHHLVRLNPDEEFIDTSKPLYVSLFGIWTKKSGYARLQPGPNGTLREEHLIWLDKSVQRLAKAKDAEVYEYVAESFEESPNAFVGGSDLKDPKQVTRTNPFQSNYAWGHSELIEYKNEQGQRLQGALFYPAGYQPGKQYPMIVYLYEKLSDGLHRYPAPSERSYYSPGAIVNHGYFLLMPDIVFRPREPGLSVAECVTAAVHTVLQTGAVDPKKVGVMGHSWGGFDSTFLATHTTLFSAAVAGAPITDLISNYGNHHWSSGIAETDHIETGQQRMQVPLWEDLQAYIRNSAVFNVQNMTTPLMIEVGDADGTVFYHQGIELYNIARRAGKNVVLLVYAGEDHGLRKKPDQIDYQHRIFAWFDHYLKDQPGPAWISDGQSYLDHQQELKLLKAQKP